MNRKSLFIAVIAAQLLFLTGMIIFHRARIQSGTRILLETTPVDPFSVFRGRYIDLNYKISTIPLGLLREDQARIKEGDDIYVILEKKGRFWEPVFVEDRLPINTHIFLKGKVSRLTSADLSIRYGMESFFLSEASADEIEGNRWTGTDWQTQQSRMDQRLKNLGEEDYRIYKAGINEWWFKTLDEELEAWRKEGTVTPEQIAALREKYKTAFLRIHAAQQQPEQTAQQPIDSQIPMTVEVAVTPDGQGYPVKLIWQGKEYK